MWSGWPRRATRRAGRSRARCCGRAGCDFSFSGLKTAVAQVVAKLPPGALARQDAADVAAGFQAAVADVMADRARHALALMPEAAALVVAGGVAANGAVRPALAAVAAGGRAAHGGAAAAAVRRQRGHGGLGRDRAAAARPGRPLDTPPRPRWPLDEMAGGVNYRHAFHAGNFADCTKHALLVWLLRALARKPAPFAVLDTHAGAGRYDLSGPAERTGEWRAGIARLLPRPPAAAGRLRGVVEAAGLYPGSPVIAGPCCGRTTGWSAANCIRRTRRAPPRVRRRRAGGGARAGRVGGAGGAAAARRRKRGLVLIDPPYEAPASTRASPRPWPPWRARFPAGIVAAWYPIKHRAPVRALHEAVRLAGVRDVVAAELWLREPTDPARLNGNGLLVRHPPFRWAEEWPAMMAALLDRLGDGEPGQGWRWTRPMSSALHVRGRGSTARRHGALGRP